ncbi:MAG: SLC13 family permease [Myxococcales bacterium]|nr:SLC13 family permease [Myxococcales bacterium]
MSWEAWSTLALVALMVAAMMRNLAAPDMVLLAGLSLLLGLGILTPAEAFSGFSNTGMLTVAVLFVVAAGVQETGGLDMLMRRALAQPRSVAAAQLRLMLPISLASAFLNNTPLVAMMVPIVQDWSRRTGISPSRLFIPLSYAAIVGGSCTLIGTATNLVVLGLANESLPELSVGIFDIAALGLPVALATMVYVLIASPWLLPDRGGGRSMLDNPREYTVAMSVAAGAPVVGQTIEQAGLRQLPGLFLIEIERADGELRPAPGPKVRLHADDRLLFAGVIDSVVDLRKIRGLSPAEDGDDDAPLAAPRPTRRLVEAVVAANSALTRQNIREARFRTRYGAAVIAVHRQGERIRSKIGDIVPQAGDTLLLETAPSFIESFRNNPTFALVSEVEGSRPVNHERAGLSFLLLTAMVISNALGLLPLLTAAMLTAFAMIVGGCLSASQARKAVDLPVLITIAAAFGIGTALDKTGVAAAIALGLAPTHAYFGSLGLMTAIYIATVVLGAVATSKAAVVLMFPITLAATRELGLPFEPFMYTLMLAAAASFTTPIGYQTNLMVYGPGRYRFIDFTRFGLPLQLIAGAVTVGFAKLLWL